MKLLVVDDDDHIRNLYVVRFSEAGYDVEGASSAEEAVGKIAFTDFDLVLMDVAMPEVDGIRALRTMKQLKPTVAAVMITAVFPDDQERRQLAEEMGVLAYWRKPQTVEELVTLIDEVVRDGKAVAPQRVSGAEASHLLAT